MSGDASSDQYFVGHSEFAEWPHWATSFAEGALKEWEAAKMHRVIIQIYHFVCLYQSRTIVLSTFLEISHAALRLARLRATKPEIQVAHGDVCGRGEAVTPHHDVHRFS